MKLIYSLLLLFSSYLQAQNSFYSFDLTKYKGDQVEYKKQVKELIEKESLFLKNLPSKSPYLLENRFHELLDLFGRSRQEIALKNQSPEGELFGMRRSSRGSAYAATPLSGQYEKYGKLLYNQMIGLLKKTLEEDLPKYKLVDSEEIEGFYSTYNVKLVPFKDLKDLATEGNFLASLIIGGRSLAPDIALGTLSIIKRNKQSGRIEKSYTLLEHVLSKHTDEEFLFPLKKENLSFLTEEDQKFIFNPSILVTDKLLAMEIAPLFAKAILWDKKNLLDLQKMTAFFRFLFAHATPYRRGSAAIAEWFEELIYTYHGYKIERIPGRLADLEAFVAFSFSSFLKNYLEITRISPKNEIL